MNITISAIWIPLVITIVLLGVMTRPYRVRGSYDFGPIFRVFWLIPILAAWVVYLAVTR